MRNELKSATGKYLWEEIMIFDWRWVRLNHETKLDAVLTEAWMGFYTRMISMT